MDWRFHAYTACMLECKLPFAAAEHGTYGLSCTWKAVE